MKVFVKGQGEVTLTQSHFVATGGQASVYVRNGVAYKIYTNPKDTIPDAKFQALAAIKDPCIIKPEALLLDGRDPIGYTMKAVSDNYTLCQLFTRSFRDRNKVTQDQIVDLASKLRTHIHNVHQTGILIVDLNELNILVSKTFDETYFIDVDSYQTKGYPATVIMPSVRDFSVKSSDFSTLSDWYSYAVLAFQLFIGIHPYRGTHDPTLTVPKDQRLEHRMRHNISVFHPGVAVPKCCYPLDIIPEPFKAWLRAVLEEGKRVAPPDLYGGPAVVIVAPVKPLVVTGLSIQEVRDFDGWKVHQHVESNGNSLTLVSKGSMTEVRTNGRLFYSGHGFPGTTLLGHTPKLNHPVGLNLHNRKLTFHDFSQKTQEDAGVIVDEISQIGDRFYVRSGGKVFEVEFAETADNGSNIMATRCVANVLEQASRLFDGVVMQNMLGSMFATLFPRHKAGYEIRLPELEGYKIIDAKFDGGVLMVVRSKKGVYDRLVFRFDEDFASYDLREVSDITPSGLNFITLDSGICVTITEEEKIEAFSAKKGSAGLKVVEDAAIGNDMRLLKVGGKAGFERGGKIYAMSLKS